MQYFPFEGGTHLDYLILGNPVTYQRGLTWEMSKYVPFLHSESSHLLSTQPTDTILALNKS